MKQVTIGLSDYKKLIDDNRYFIDKTLIVKEFLDDSADIVLTPRSRRFGKTLKLSIVRYFLEKSSEDRKYLFKGTNIEKDNETMKKQGTYPVIYLTLKDEKHDDFNGFIESIRNSISSVYKGFYYIYDSLNFQDDKKYFDSIINREAGKTDLEMSLLRLIELLNSYYNKKVIILID